MRFWNWLQTMSPDIERTLRRFPFAIVLLAIAACFLVALINEWLPTENTETLARGALGLAAAAMTATAGQLFLESRPERHRLGFLAIYILPLVVILLFQVRSTDLIVLPALFFVPVFWMSLAAFTRWRGVEDRNEMQDRFWWLNHRALFCAAIALIAFLLIALGLLAIERSLALLFGLHIETALYQYVLPIIGSFFVPVYWLATLPKLDEFKSQDLVEPDFTSRAIGFLGQFILVPLLLAYALILYAYAVQIAMIGALPTGTLGWMVMAFTITGAANWLVLHPQFMQDRLLVRLFQRYWFWLTLLPLALYALAVWQRVDAYGLTLQRVLLIYGGVWALSVTIVFLIPRLRDIRWVVVSAGLLLLLASVGPLSASFLSNMDQARRLDMALDNLNFANGANALNWDAKRAEQARTSLYYLIGQDGGAGWPHAHDILQAHGVQVTPEEPDASTLVAGLHLPDDIEYVGTSYSLSRGLSASYNVSETPIYLGSLNLYATMEQPIPLGQMVWALQDNMVHWEVADNAARSGAYGLTVWLQTLQMDGDITEAFLRFDAAGTRYGLIVQNVYWTVDVDGERQIISLDGTLFGDHEVELPQPPEPSGD